MLISVFYIRKETQHTRLGSFCCFCKCNFLCCLQLRGLVLLGLLFLLRGETGGKLFSLRKLGSDFVSLLFGGLFLLEFLGFLFSGLLFLSSGQVKGSPFGF